MSTGRVVAVLSSRRRWRAYCSSSLSCRGSERQIGALDAWCPAGRLAGPGELRRVGPAMLSPAFGVDPAQRRSRLSPHVAVADQARGRRVRHHHGRLPGGPRAGVGPPGPFPPAGVPRAQSPLADPEPAAGDPAPARWQRAVTVPRRGHGRREAGRVRPSRRVPPPQVTLAHPAAVHLPPAPVHQAHAAAEHRVGGIEHQHIGAELRAHRGHQLLQQAGCRDTGQAGAGHQVTSRPVNQPAFSSAARASCRRQVPVNSRRHGHRRVP